MSPDFSGSALLLLFACALKATLVFAVAFIVAGIARHSSAAFRHLVWVSAILGALALPLLTCLLPAWRSAALGSTARFLSVSSQQAASQPDLSALPAMIVNAATSVPAHRWSSLFLLVWFLGILLFALRIVVGLARLRWLCSRCTPASSPDLMREASQLSACFNLPRRVLVIANHASFTMPMTWGIFRPIILLPSAAAGWPELRRRIVLTHEFAHIARRDWLFQICAEVACALYWFHPLAWLAARHLRQESERACDDAVLRSGVAAPDYAQHLLHLAATLSHRGRVWSSALAVARASHLERRFTAMLNPSLDRRSLSSRATTAASLFVLLLLIPLAALRLPAQNAAGRFSGAILDPSAAVVPNATVIMTDSQTSKSAMTTTDLQGKFSFASLPSGEYDLRAIKRGFADFKAHETLAIGQDKTQDITLNIAAVAYEEDVVAKGTAKAVSAEPGGKATRLRVGGDIQAGKIVSKVQPVYPEAAKAAGSQGTVVLHAVIGTDGTVLSLRVVNDKVDPELARASIESVAKWRYSPTLLNGQPIEVETTIEVNFTLQP